MTFLKSGEMVCDQCLEDGTVTPTPVVSGNGVATCEKHLRADMTAKGWLLPDGSLPIDEPKEGE
jgi:hypothetical protein